MFNTIIAAIEIKSITKQIEDNHTQGASQTKDKHTYQKKIPYKAKKHLYLLKHCITFTLQNRNK